MKSRIVKIMLIMLVALGVGTVASNAAISGSSQTVNSGENVTITINSDKKISSYNVSMTSDGGLNYVSCEDLNGGQSGNKVIAGSPANGTTKLGKFTFKAPTVTTDTKYTVKFSATAMETPDLEEVSDSSTSIIITVKAPKVETDNNKPSSNEGNSSDKDNNSGSTTTEKSSNNKLKNLGIKPNDFSGFKSNTTKYNVTVPNSVAEVEVYATAQDSKATISGTGKMKLDVGSNQAKVICTAEDGTTKTYVINITRKSQEEEKQEQQPEEKDPEEVLPTENEPIEEIEEDPVETNQITIGLSKLEAIGKNEKGENVEVELTPTFDENQQEYLLTVPLSVVDVEINATATDGEAKIEVMGNKSLVEGENIITVIVKIEENTKVYEIKVNKVEMETSFLSQELIMQLAVIAAIITIVLVAIIVIIVMIVRNSKKGKSVTEISNEILPDDDKTE